MSAKLKIVLADLFYVNRLTQNRLCVPLNVAYVAAYTEKLEGMDYDSLTDDERGWLNCRRAYLASID